MKHLNDQTTYKLLNENTTHKLKDIINLKLDALHKNGFLLTSWYQFCKPPIKHRTSKLYFLKKIHKNPMGIRPIVSSCESITEKISQFVDKWLQPYVKSLPSYVKDTTEFINQIERTKLPTHSKLASIDVSSLYTNIPHHEGIQSALHFLKNSPNTYKYPEQPNPDIIGELMTLVLQNNVFEFNEEYYLQIQGTAMGTKMAPAYANLFMGRLEPQLISHAAKHIHTWKRFIDDIFIIWTGTTEEFEQFMIHLNQIHPTIKFTHEVSENELTFLDITLYKGDRFKSTNTLDLKTHIKETNKQLYVHSKSYHPPATIKAIAKGETKRYLRTNSNETNFNETTLKLVHKLKQRGYKHNQIINHIKDISFNDRIEALKRKNKAKQTDKLVFVTHYTDDINRIKGIFRKHWKLIKNNTLLNHIFPSPPVIAYKANPSLKKKLVRAKLKPLDQTTPNQNPNPTSTPNTNTNTQTEGNPPTEPDYPYNLFKHTTQHFRNPIKRCNNECSICKQLETKTFAYSTTRTTKTPITPPPINKHYNCKSRNVVYLITCKEQTCGAQYVGYTMRQLKERLTEHKTNTNSPVHRHCLASNHFDKLIIQILTQAPTDERNPELWLKQQEYYWICKLGTLAKLSLKGLNKLIYDPTIRTK